MRGRTPLGPLGVASRTLFGVLATIGNEWRLCQLSRNIFRVIQLTAEVCSWPLARSYARCRPVISQFVKRGLVVGGRLRFTRLGGAGGGDGDGVRGHRGQ